MMMNQDPEKGISSAVDHDDSDSLPLAIDEKYNEEADHGSSPASSHAPSSGTIHVSENEEVFASPSKAESTSPQPVKVPRSQRRGLFGRFTLLAEVEEPKDYPRPTKWFITFTVAVAAAAAPMGSAIFFRKTPKLNASICPWLITRQR